MRRRQFLRSGTGTLLAGGLALNGLRTWAAPAGGATIDSRLLVVFLRGGYDACNVLVPLASPFYAEARPNLAIARPGAGADAALHVDADWGLAPALRTSLHPRVLAGEVAFVPFAGTTDLSRSHFETQDAIEHGLPRTGEAHAADVPRRDVDSGFLNRLAQTLGARLDDDRRVMAFTERLPIMLQGPRVVANAGLGRVQPGGLDARQAALVERMYAGTALEARVREGLATRAEVAREMADEMPAPMPREMSGAMSSDKAREMAQASRNAISAHGFQGMSERIAHMMRDDVRIGFVDIGGWDTHVAQGGATGALASRVADLGQGLDAFARDMGPAWSRTVVVVISEFGRTFRENGNRGTDHGHGTTYWVLGGAVRGGIRGEQVALTPATLNEGRDLPVLNEYRAVLGGLFRRMYGLDAAQLQRVFPGATARDLQLV
jgi:uncharacterized protein (DUF1501 family)